MPVNLGRGFSHSGITASHLHVDQVLVGDAQGMADQCEWLELRKWAESLVRRLSLDAFAF
jgi:hypothetical protein